MSEHSIAVRSLSQYNLTNSEPVTATTFREFVAINAQNSSPTSITRKAAKSFLNATINYENPSDEDSLKLWLAVMAEKEMSPESVKRYYTKISALFDQYYGSQQSQESPFDSVRSLLSSIQPTSSTAIYDITSALTKSFASLADDAKSRPALALFTYLLFNASSDIERGIMLLTDEYESKFEQLNMIIDPADFHHRRRYVFALNQSRKRSPQLLNETTTAIDNYLRSREIKADAGLQPQLIPTLWAAKARSIGISMADIRAVIDCVPQEFEWLNLVTPSPLTDGQIMAIKQQVADAFFPTAQRWFALKLRKHTPLATMQQVVSDTHSPAFMDTVDLFYPIKETAKRKGKKIVTEQSPLIPDIVFIKTTPDQLAKLDRTVRKNGIGWIFRTINTPDAAYSTIDNRSMALFQRAVGQFSDDFIVDLTPRQPLEIGRKVRITGGQLAGYEGTIYDIHESADDARRMIYITLSDTMYVRMQVEIDEIFIEPLS